MFLASFIIDVKGGEVKKRGGKIPEKKRKNGLKTLDVSYLDICWFWYYGTYYNVTYVKKYG